MASFSTLYMSSKSFSSHDRGIRTSRVHEITASVWGRASRAGANFQFLKKRALEGWPNSSTGKPRLAQPEEENRCGDSRYESRKMNERKGKRKNGRGCKSNGDSCPNTRRELRLFLLLLFTSHNLAQLIFRSIGQGQLQRIPNNGNFRSLGRDLNFAGVEGIQLVSEFVVPISGG